LVRGRKGKRGFGPTREGGKKSRDARLSDPKAQETRNDNLEDRRGNRLDSKGLEWRKSCEDRRNLTRQR